MSLKLEKRNLLMRIQRMKGTYLQAHVGSGPEALKLFSCSTQLSTEFQLLMKT